jgi:hypothetical protein
VLEMSPMPIREAVRRLDAAGLVENIPHRGARVTELSTTDLAEVYEARLALEVRRARRGERTSATRRTDRVLRRHLCRDLGGSRNVSLRALRRRRLGLAPAPDPSDLGDRGALLPGGPGMPPAGQPLGRARGDPRRVRGPRSRARGGRAPRPPRDHREQHLGRDGRRAAVRAGCLSRRIAVETRAAPIGPNTPASDPRGAAGPRPAPRARSRRSRARSRGRRSTAPSLRSVRPSAPRLRTRAPL